jgi:hypothetical protein
MEDVQGVDDVDKGLPDENQNEEEAVEER